MRKIAWVLGACVVVAVEACGAPRAPRATAPVYAARPLVSAAREPADGSAALAAARRAHAWCAEVTFDRWEDYRSAWIDVCGVRRLFAADAVGAFFESPRTRSTPPAGARPDAYPESGSGPVHVRGYYRRDGTYVRPHTRHRPR